MKKTDLFFPVKKIQSNQFIPGHKFTSQNSFAIVAYPPGETPKIVNFCSEGYQLIPNEHIINPFEEELKKHFEFEPRYQMRDHKRFFIDYMIKDKNLSVGDKKDKIIPKIRIHNSYDGGLKYSIIMGFFRLICSNGLAIPDVDAKGNKKESKIKLMHTPQISDGMALSVLMKQMEEFITMSEDYSKVYHILYDNMVNKFEDRVEEVINATKFPIRQKEAVMARATLERDEHQLKMTDWLLYNAFNYVLFNSEDVGMQEHKREKVDNQILNFMVANPA